VLHSVLSVTNAFSVQCCLWAGLQELFDFVHVCDRAVVTVPSADVRTQRPPVGARHLAEPKRALGKEETDDVRVQPEGGQLQCADVVMVCHEGGAAVELQ